MSNIFNREIDGVSVTYDSEEKNQLGIPAIAKSAKEAMGKQAVYTFDVGSGAVAFVKLNEKTIAKHGEPKTLGESGAIKKVDDTIYFVVEEAKATSGSSAELKFDSEGTDKIKLDVVDVTTTVKATEEAAQA